LWVERYFQNEAFFLREADEIRRIFSISAELPEWVGGRTPVAVHVRPGDYLAGCTHAPLPPSYYHEAMNLMRERVADPVFLVFSDEPGKCRKSVDNGADAVLMPRLDQFDTLGLMQSCEDHIIANSTFSWWSAWLSESVDVICPARFFPDREWKICPARWTHLPICD
jgi:hypothetical protein